MHGFISCMTDAEVNNLFYNWLNNTLAAILNPSGIFKNICITQGQLLEYLANLESVIIINTK